MPCTSTEDLRNFWPSNRQWSWYHITVYQVKRATHAVHWLTPMLWVRKVPISNTTLKVNYSESHCGIVCLHFLLRHYNCLPDTYNLLQATEHTVIWWLQCAWNESRYQLDVWTGCKSKIIQNSMQLVWRWITFLPKSDIFLFLHIFSVCTTPQKYVVRILGYQGENEVGNLTEFDVNLLSNNVSALGWNFLSKQKFDHEIWKQKKGRNIVHTWICLTGFCLSSSNKRSGR